MKPIKKLLGLLLVAALALSLMQRNIITTRTIMIILLVFFILPS